MRIAYLALVELDVPNACLIHAREIAENMERLGNPIELFLPLPLKKEKWQITRHHWVHFWGFDPLRRFCFMIEAVLRLAIAHWRCRFDILYLREVAVPRLLIGCCRLWGLPIIVEVNGWLLDDMELLKASVDEINAAERNQRRLLTAALGVVASTEGNAHNLMRHYAIPADRVMVQELGVNFEHFSSVDRKQARHAVGLEKGKWLLFAGSFHPHHDLKSLIDAYCLVRVQQPEVRLALVGDGAQHAAAQQWVQERQLESMVYFAGHRPYEEMPQWFAAADVIISPLLMRKIRQQNGALATKVWEAMASGTPVVVTDLPDCGSWGTLEKLAWLCLPEEPVSMSEAIIAALEPDERDLERVQRAQQYVKDNRSWSKAAADTLHFIRRQMKDGNHVRD